MRFQMIERCRESFPVTIMCRLLKVSRSGFYDWSSRKPGKRRHDSSRLLRKIKHLHLESYSVFGNPRIWEELRYEGQRCSLNREFTATEENTKWVTDIIYIRTGEGWLYLAVIVDLFMAR